MVERSSSEATSSSEEGDRPPDREMIRTVLADHPIRLAVLFGSHVTGTADAGSDVDLAVELEPDTDERASEVLVGLLADLSVALDRNDIDLSSVGDLEPRVGLAAFSEGDLLFGSPARAERHRVAFERRMTPQSRSDLRGRFDDVIEHVDATLREEA